MASLSAQQALARRRSAALLFENTALRATLQQAVRENHRRRHECLLSLACTSRLRAEPIPSPWSDLRWQRPGTALDGLLVAVPD